MTFAKAGARTRPMTLAVIAAVTLVPSLAADLVPTPARACACGCGIFDVGGASGITPDYTLGNYSVYFRYDYMNQGTNWEGDSKAAASDNSDKNINTSFYFVGGQWHINRSWTLMSELPVFARHLTTTDDGTVQGPSGSIYTGKIVSLGDLEIMGDYTGLSPDMSTGIIAGLKLPTGDFHGPRGPLGSYEFDRDSLPGTGSTDLILGAYHDGALSEDGRVGYYIQGRAQIPFLTQSVAANGGGYRPGDEFDNAAGVDYSFDRVRPFTSVSPVLSLLSSFRLHDTGGGADPYNSGYYRLLVAPGVEVHYANIRFYADLEVPVFQHTNAASSLAINGTSGQLVASPLFKVQVNYDF
jgi:hypothetical protein